MLFCLGVHFQTNKNQSVQEYILTSDPMHLDYILLFSVGLLLFFMLLYFFAYLDARGRKDPKPKKYPGISIIVPIWNEEDTIKETLGCLVNIKKKYAGDFEVIVVDDNSTDNSYSLTKELANKYKFIKLVTKKGKKGKAESFNEATKIAKYELVACVDADAFPEEKSLEYIVGYFADEKVGAVTTKMVVKDPKKLVEWFQHIEYLFSNFLLSAYGHLESIYVTKGPLSVYRKRVLKKIGGFKGIDITPTEDMEITFRIRKAGYTIKNSIDAKVSTRVMPTWKKLFWQRVRWNRGSLINFTKHRDMMFDRQYGFFSMVMMPIITITISMLAIVIYYLIFNLINILVNFFVKMYWYAYLKIIPNPFIALQRYFEINFAYVVSYLIVIIAFAGLVWIITYAVGFYESKEKLKIKHIIILILTPIIYTPAQIIFWVSAIILQLTKYKSRWR